MSAQIQCPVMSIDGGGGPPAGNLQFDKAEFAASPAAMSCALCKKPIVDEYFSAGGHVLCRSCSQQYTKGGRLLPAFGYGAGAALIGTIVWYAVIKLFDMELGLIAIGVGLLVGMAVRKGSGGRGGAKFQALAMALTYLSITFSYVPLVLKGMAQGFEKQEKAKQEKQEKATPGGLKPGEPAADQTGAGTEKSHEPAAKSAEPTEKGPGTALALLIFFGLVFGLALAGPFLAGAQNILGIAIIGIALYEAWKLNRAIPIQGPFRVAAAAAPPAVSAG